MLERFFPDEYISSTYAIPFDRLYEEGYRGIIFDIDNTLVPHGAPADERAKQLFRDLKELGYSCCLLSNNQELRVKMLNEEMGISIMVITHDQSVADRCKKIMHLSDGKLVTSGN